MSQCANGVVLLAKIYDGCLVRVKPDSAIVPHQVLEHSYIGLSLRR